MYQALYRKWRPQKFSDVIGQKHITDSLRNQVKNDHLSHAYLFTGTRGVGKTSCARILAKAANCEHPVNGDPCCECASCRGIADGTIMDIVELDAASNNGVDNVRALRDEAVFSPATVKKRVYIIDEVHMLSTSAFNALLKILEEPPEHLMFILATTELQKVPATILSRCQRHTFKRIRTSELAAFLEDISAKENIDITPDAAELIAGLAEGSVRDSLSMLDQCASMGERLEVDKVYASVGLAGNIRSLSIFNGICRHDTESVISEFDSLWQDGKDPAVILKELSNLARDVLMLKVAPNNSDALIYGGYNRKALLQLAEAMTTEELICIIDTLQNARGSMRDAFNPKMTAEICLISLANNTLGYSLANLRARVAALESAVSSRAAIRSPAPVIITDELNASSVQSKVSEPIAELSLRKMPEIDNYAKIPAAHAAPAVPAAEPAEDIFDAEAATDSPQSAPMAEGEDAQELWNNIRDDIKPKLKADMRAFLSDVSCSINGGVMTLGFKNKFYLSRFNQDAFTSLVKESALKFTGKEYILKLEETIPQSAQNIPPEGHSLEQLRQFNEVTFIN